MQLYQFWFQSTPVSGEVEFQPLGQQWLRHLKLRGRSTCPTPEASWQECLPLGLPSNTYTAFLESQIPNEKASWTSADPSC